MAAVRRPAAPAMWLSVNVARMIVVVLAPPGDDGGTPVTACCRPRAVVDVRSALQSRKVKWTTVYIGWKR